ncbi:Uncharacterised protein [Raoultella ornithinolytica]|nr:Uncharacterised protein [Raoultella ornithinolytica]
MVQITFEFLNLEVDHSEMIFALFFLGEITFIIMLIIN